MITIKDNGPVVFLEDETPFDEIESSDCNCVGREFCQIVHSGDTTPFQVGLGDPTGAELVSNGSFTTDTAWTKGSGWTITGGKAVHTASGGGALVCSSNLAAKVSTYYKIQFDISDYSNSQTLSVVFAGDTIKSLNSDGSYTVYWFTDAALVNPKISFTPHSTTSLKVDNVTIKEMTTIVYGIKDFNGDVVKTVSNGTGVIYYQDTASIEVDWSDVDDGCYRLFLIDNGDNLFVDAQSGEFDGLAATWNVQNQNFSFGRSSAQSHAGTFSGLFTFEDVATSFVPLTDPLIFYGKTDITVEANKDYIISAWIYFPSAIIASSPATNFVYLRPTTYSLSQCGTVIGATCHQPSFFPITRKEVYIDGNFISDTQIGLAGIWVQMRTFFNTGANTSLKIGAYLNGNLALYPDSGFEFYIDSFEMRGPVDIESECFKKGEFDCTKLLTWSNNENAYGFTYEGTAFEHKLRVKSKLWKPKYPKDKKEVFVDSAGNRRILTSRTKKEEILNISEMPEYLHNALSIGVEHDNFYIDGVKYINEETDYDPSWRNSSMLAPVELVVTKDSQDLSNSYC